MRLNIIFKKNEDVLMRFASVCYKRKIAIKTLYYSSNEKYDTSTVKAELLCDEKMANQFILHLNNVEGVMKVIKEEQMIFH